MTGWIFEDAAASLIAVLEAVVREVLRWSSAGCVPDIRTSLTSYTLCRLDKLVHCPCRFVEFLEREMGDPNEILFLQSGGYTQSALQGGGHSHKYSGTGL